MGTAIWLDTNQWSLQSNLTKKETHMNVIQNVFQLTRNLQALTALFVFQSCLRWMLSEIFTASGLHGAKIPELSWALWVRSDALVLRGNVLNWQCRSRVDFKALQKCSLILCDRTGGVKWWEVIFHQWWTRTPQMWNGSDRELQWGPTIWFFVARSVSCKKGQKEVAGQFLQLEWSFFTQRCMLIGYELVWQRVDVSAKCHSQLRSHVPVGSSRSLKLQWRGRKPTIIAPITLRHQAVHR